MEDRVRTFISEAQRRGEFRSGLTAEWLTATLHAIVHAAATEIDAGRLEAALAPDVITATMLGILRPNSG